jgi:hypothetical protein
MRRFLERKEAELAGMPAIVQAVGVKSIPQRDTIRKTCRFAAISFVAGPVVSKPAQSQALQE